MTAGGRGKGGATMTRDDRGETEAVALTLSRAKGTEGTMGPETRR